MSAVLLLVLALLLAGCGGEGSGGARWTAPELEDPETIRLGTGPTVTRLDPGRDYVVELPEQTKRGATVLVGGRNVVIDGGSIAVRPTADGDERRRALYIKDARGTVHVEDVRIDGSGAPSDGVAISAPDAVVQLQDLAVEDLRGSVSGWHADIVQPWGGVRELRIDRLRGSSNYQGLFLRPDLGEIGRVVLSRVDLRLTDEPTDGGGHLLWLATGCDAPEVTLEDVRLSADDGRPAEQLVWPQPDDPKCPARAAGGRLSWPGLPVNGTVTAGAR